MTRAFFRRCGALMLVGLSVSPSSLRAEAPRHRSGSARGLTAEVRPEATGGPSSAGAAEAAPRPTRPGPDEPGAPQGAVVTPLPASQPAARSNDPRELRFDALRVDGQLRGPAMLEVRALRGADRSPLFRLRRSFVGRIFETVEAPALYQH